MEATKADEGVAVADAAVENEEVADETTDETVDEREVCGPTIKLSADCIYCKDGKVEIRAYESGLEVGCSGCGQSEPITSICLDDEVLDELAPLPQEIDDAKGKDGKVLMAQFRSHRARFVKHVYKAKDHVHEIVLTIPADPAHAAAMLRMQDECVNASFVLEDFPAEPEKPVEDETMKLPFRDPGDAEAQEPGDTEDGETEEADAEPEEATAAASS